LQSTDYSLADGVTLSSLIDTEQGYISRRIFSDSDIYELEMERIFRRTWLFLGHESEIPNPGDNVTRSMAGEPVILVRDGDGVVRAFLNSCRHRGMRLCRADFNNSSHFRCPYHGWTYKNTGELTWVPIMEMAYGKDCIDKSKWGLIPVAQLDTYAGMIFGNWDSEADSLDDFLGDLKWYLDLVMKRTDGGMEVIGPPQRWEVPANWKFGADNFSGDNYHIFMTHRSTIELGLSPPDPKFTMYAHEVSLANGHGINFVGCPPEIPVPPYLGLPDVLWPQIERNLSAGQAQVLKGAMAIPGNLFPNLALLNVSIGRDEQSPPVPFLTWRYWEPTGPTSMRIWSWFFVEKSAPEQYKQDSYKTYVRTFGPSGVFEQDDMENWVECTRASSGKIAQRYPFNHTMGINHLEMDSEWPGPGEAYPSGYTEGPQRGFYKHWLKLMTSDDGGRLDS